MVVEGDGPVGMTAVTVIKQSGYAYGAQQTFPDTEITWNLRVLISKNWLYSWKTEHREEEEEKKKKGVVLK